MSMGCQGITAYHYDEPSIPKIHRGVVKEIIKRRAPKSIVKQAVKQ